MQDVKMSDGCVIKAKVIGGSDRSKPLMLACHGAPGVSNHLETQTSYGVFQDQFRLLLFDLRGSGLSEKKGPYTHQQWVKDIDELREWVGDEKVVFVGSSHGGYLALEYALAYPQHVTALVVNGTGAQFAHWGILEAFKRVLTDPRSKDHVGDLDKLVRVFTGTVTDDAEFAEVFGVIAPLYASPKPDEAEGDVTAFMGSLSTVAPPDREVYNAALGACLSRYDVRDRLQEIAVPVLICVGRHDFILPVQHSEFLEKNLPKGKMIIYEKSGHLVSIEEKTKWTKDVREFLAKLRL